MDETMCSICHKITKWFYENMTILKAKHSAKAVPEIISIILSKNSASVCGLDDASAICFKCADKINEFDEVCEKLQTLEQELKSLICKNMIIKYGESEAEITPTPTDQDALTDVNEVQVVQLAANNCTNDTVLDTSRNSVEIRHLEQPPISQEDSVVQQEPIADFVTEKPQKEKKEKKTMNHHCSECKTSYSTYAGLRLHVYYSHLVHEQFECSACHKVYRQKHHLEMHIAGDCSGVKRIECTKCAKSFLPKSYKMHKAAVHGFIAGPPFICDYCGTKFDDKKSIIDHKQLHIDRPKFQCLECDRIVSTKQALKTHMSIHTEEKSHLCEICGKSFRLDGSLKKHIKRHYSDYNFECYLCKHGRLSLYSLHKHMRVHTGVKPFKCSYCHKKFSERNNRDTHYRLHFGPTEKPHKCTVCSEAFTRPGLLSRHYMNVHGVDMPGLTAKKFIKLKR